MPSPLWGAGGLLLLCACASIGSPDGGPYDEEPPHVVKGGYSPELHALNVKDKKVSIRFNEYIKLENASEKVVVTPPQTEVPNIRAVGKEVRVDLYDDLLPNTTYTIDFGDAIVDNNEGNPMGFFTYSFSTGDRIDTMEVAGTVLNAADLEPVKGIFVGLYNADSTYSDTVLCHHAPERMGRTNSLGRFSVKGLAPGRYRAVALKDADNNYIFNQKSEQIAFDPRHVYETTSRPDFYRDTVWADTVHWTKIRLIPYTHYLPDDITLLAFLEEGGDQHLLKTERPVPERFTLYFTAPRDTLPLIEGLNFDASRLVVEPRPTLDTLTYWLPDTLDAYQDTLTFRLTYLDTDTLGVLQPRTDTLQLTPKLTQEKRRRQLEEQVEKWQKDFDKRAKRSKEPLPPETCPLLTTWMEATIRPSGTIDPDKPLLLTFSEPVARVDSSGLRFEMRVDSQYVSAPYRLLPVEGEKRMYRLYAEWEPGATYRFQADSLTFESILGHRAKSQKLDIHVRRLEEYGTLHINVGTRDTCLVVQLMTKGDKPVATAEARGGIADFYYLKPQEYYLRAFIDANRNGRWDTGDYAAGRQPEEVFYCPLAVPVRAEWDIDNDWDPRALPLTEQKPKALTKAKPDKTRSTKERNKQRLEELGKNKRK